MISSYRNKKALLIGNGVNLLDSEQSFSWGHLLMELQSSLEISVDLDNIFKPFPLAFDEILHRKLGSGDVKDKIKILKQRIRQNIDKQLDGKKGFNEYHRKLVSLGYNDILTTNYDYSLEKSVLPIFNEVKNKLPQNREESKHSLKRHYDLVKHNTVVWHIHGELFDSRSLSTPSIYYNEESIMIGYEHYASYLEQIQNNINGKKGTQKITSQSLMVRLRNRKPSPFWTDIFFTHNLDIVGQAFDFSENHLWWLINYRANAMRTKNIKFEVVIDNVIRFFYPQKSDSGLIDISEGNYTEKIIDKINTGKKMKAIADVLEAFNVIPRPIKCESYEDFYDQLTSEYLINS